MYLALQASDDLRFLSFLEGKFPDPLVNPNTRASTQVGLARFLWFLFRYGVKRLAEVDEDLAMSCLDWMAKPAALHQEPDTAVPASLVLPDTRVNPAWRPFEPSHSPTPSSIGRTIFYSSAFYG